MSRWLGRWRNRLAVEPFRQVKLNFRHGDFPLDRFLPGLQKFPVNFKRRHGSNCELILRRLW